MKVSVRALILLNVLIRTSRNQIINGDPAPSQLLTHQVSITYFGSHICSGAIIDKTHVLTAAHCVHGCNVNFLSVITGRVRLDSFFLWDKFVSRVQVHPNFTYFTRPELVHDDLGLYFLPQSVNDIAVLTLKGQLEFGDSVSKIELPKSNIGPCSFGLYSGWGKIGKNGPISMDLMLISLMIIEKLSCRRYGLAPEMNSQFCAIDPLGLGTSAPGDSGGPLIHNARIIGVQTAGSSDPNFPVLFENVYFHREFIIQAMLN